jgi:D-alanyl-lipoteichoic acid acyltransferase DltB (MBOAT superfamily)
MTKVVRTQYLVLELYIELASILHGFDLYFVLREIYIDVPDTSVIKIGSDQTVEPKKNRTRILVQFLVIFYFLYR